MSNIRLYDSEGLDIILETKINLLETLNIIEKIDIFLNGNKSYKRSGDLNYDIDNDLVEVFIEEV